jgi:Kef-type K+ transport system membrane component KefB/nucleotide-binding universal stress UspA family protein
MSPFTHGDTALRRQRGPLFCGVAAIVTALTARRIVCVIACLVACLMVSLALSTMDAFAAEGGRSGPSEVIFLAQLIVLILIGRLLGEAMTRIGQPSVIGMLLGGILLGPSALGLLWPDLQEAIFPKTPEQKSMLDGIAQFGILLLLLLTGMETDLKLVRKVGQPALIISISGVVVPFICGFVLGQLMPETLLPHPDQRLITSLFLGIALSISSIKIVAAVVREMDFIRRNLGQLIVASAICEDSIGWIIIAITLSLAEAGTMDLASVSRSVLGTAVFLIASFTIGRRLVFFIMRWANDNFESDFPVITAILVIMGVMALTTHFIGVHTVLGAFVAGVLIGDSPILSKHVDEQLRGLIVAFFMPVFFGISGLSTDLTVLKSPSLAIMTLAIIAAASFGKFAGAFLGGAIGGLTLRESLALGCAMNARGSTEVIVASIGLSMGALSQDLFTIIVAMAIITTMAMPPMLRWALARVPMRTAEKERLDREQMEEKEFVPNIERLLLAVDESPNGKLAARLAGLIAGTRALPTTVLSLAADGKSSDAREMKTEREGAALNEARRSDVARAAARTKKDPHDEQMPLSNITVRTLEKPNEEAVATEAKKGYGLLIVGIKNTRTRSNEFHRDVARIVSAFEGPVAIVAGRNGQLKHPEQCPSNILVPVAGTEVSRRAGELAIAIARACGCPITALYVANTGASRARKWRGIYGRRQARAIISEVAEMGERYGVRVKRAVRADVAPDQAILTHAKRTGYDLLIMGASRRPGDKLFLGDTAAAVFEHAPCSVLFLVS